MKALPLTLHLLNKDLRHQRVWLALLWVLALLLPITARLVNGTGDGAMLPAIAGFFLLMLVMLAWLIEIDAPGRRLHFLATRPVPWNVLLAEKALFAAVFLLLPVWIAKMGTVFLLRIPVNATDVTLLLVENTIRMAALMSAVALFASFFRNLWVVFLTMIGASALVLVGVVFLMRAASAALSGSPPPPGGMQSLVLCAALAMMACITIAFRFRQKTTLKPLCALGAGLFVYFALWNYWPWNHLGLFSRTPPISMPLQPDIPAKVTLDSKARTVTKGSRNDIPFNSVDEHLSIGGVELPYFATVSGCVADAKLKSGKVLHSFSNLDDIHLQFLWHDNMSAGRMMQKISGFKPRFDPPGGWNPQSAEIFEYNPDQVAKEDLSGATIKGKITVSIAKLVLVKTLPFKEGGVLGFPREGHVFKDIVFTPGGASFKIITNRVASTLRGDDMLVGWNMRLLWLVFNRRRNEYLTSGGSGGGGSTSIFCDVTAMDEQLQLVPIDPTKPQQPMPEDWADGAEISFFTVQQCGQITVPFEEDNVDLSPDDNGPFAGQHH